MRPATKPAPVRKRVLTDGSLPARVAARRVRTLTATSEDAASRPAAAAAKRQRTLKPFEYSKTLRPTGPESKSAIGAGKDLEDAAEWWDQKRRSELEAIWPKPAKRKQAGESESSDGTTSVASIPSASKAGRQRVLRRRKRHRLGRYWEAAQAVTKLGVSFLEHSAVTPAVAKEYRKQYEELQRELERRGAADLADGELDAVLADILTSQFFKGEQPSKGEKTMASLLHWRPKYNKVGGHGLPRAWRALKGWKRLCPGKSRKPEPLKFWFAMATHMVRIGGWKKAVCLLLMLSTYLRPSAAISLRKGSLQSPAPGATKVWSVLAHPEEEGTTSKTGERDVSILVDSKWIQFLGPAWEILTKGSPADPLWDFNYLEFLTDFKTVAAMLNAPRTVPYQLRHSGASVDRASGERTTEDVRRRGRWRSANSIARYEKPARLATSLRQHSSDMQSHFDQCERVLESVLLFGAPAPALPRAQSGSGGRQRA